MKWAALLLLAAVGAGVVVAWVWVERISDLGSVR